MKKKLIIELHHGLVTNVITNTELDEVIVVDKDNQDNGEYFIDHLVEITYYPYECLHTIYGTDCTRDQEIMEVLKTHKI